MPIIMKYVLFALLICRLSSVYAQSDANASGEEKKLGPEKIVLQKDTVWDENKLVLVNGTVIKTDGHSLTIIANQFAIDGTATIYSFDPGEIPSKIADAPPSAAGKSYDRGPTSGGAGDGINGSSGGAGDPGISGTAGTAGRNAGVIRLVLKGLAQGNLTITNDGSDGGPGGKGGDGGGGGNGQQGGRGIPKKLFGVVIGAERGPAVGGKGGDGGRGGNGGKGGDGGNGGEVIVESSQLNEALHINASAKAGKPGQGGLPGKGGAPGLNGYGGRGTVGVSGREFERAGKPGIAGADGSSGVPGLPGTPGNIKLAPNITNTLPLIP
jgi:hypothetical protein